jgi:hypothetical protein
MKNDDFINTLLNGGLLIFDTKQVNICSFISAALGLDLNTNTETEIPALISGEQLKQLKFSFIKGKYSCEVEYKNIMYKINSRKTSANRNMKNISRKINEYLRNKSNNNIK